MWHPTLESAAIRCIGKSSGTAYRSPAQPNISRRGPATASREPPWAGPCGRMRSTDKRAILTARFVEILLSRKRGGVHEAAFGNRENHHALAVSADRCRILLGPVGAGLNPVGAGARPGRGRDRHGAGTSREFK